MRHVMLILGLCLSAGIASAQAFGSITGEVRDPSGAVMPNAAVTATNIGTMWRGRLRPTIPEFIVSPT